MGARTAAKPSRPTARINRLAEDKLAPKNYASNHATRQNSVFKLATCSNEKYLRGRPMQLSIRKLWRPINHRHGVRFFSDGASAPLLIQHCLCVFPYIKIDGSMSGQGPIWRSRYFARQPSTLNYPGYKPGTLKT